jgi:hypothetical protein
VLFVLLFRVSTLTQTDCFQPKYLPGIIGACVCLGLQFLVICGAFPPSSLYHRVPLLLTRAAWRTVYVLRNRQRDRAAASDGISLEERERQGKLNGEKDMSDFENRRVRAFSHTFARFGAEGTATPVSLYAVTRLLKQLRVHGRIYSFLSAKS